MEYTSSADLYDFLQGNRDFFYCNIESTDLIEVNKKFLVSSFIANAIVFFSLKYNGDRCITIGVNPHFIEYPFFNCTYINIQYLYINAEMIDYISKQNIDKFFRWVTIWVHNEVNLVFPDKTIYYYLLLNEQSELNKTIIKKIGLYHQNILKKEYKGKSAELFEKKVDMI